VQSTVIIEFEYILFPSHALYFILYVIDQEERLKAHVLVAFMRCIALKSLYLLIALREESDWYVLNMGGFEFRLKHGYFSSSFYVVLSFAFATGCLFVQRSPTKPPCVRRPEFLQGL
jgi:hypothetical protein